MIKVSTNLFLELNDPDHERKKYRSKLLDYQDNQLFIDYPVDEETKKPHFLFPGTELKVWFIGKDEAIYLFHTEVLGKLEKKIPMLIIHDPGQQNYIRIQRRQYVRIDTAIDVAIHSIDQSFPPFTTITLDISGGGIATLIPKNNKLPDNTVVSLYFPLHFQTGDIYFIKTKGKLIRIIEKQGQRKGSFQFIDLTEGDRQKIVRYCYEKQLNLRKKVKQ
ncbi:flagellar brake protein [Evansella tamaricis]|uniref:Flagellar brake domain-containing protein n=1 Tax=Evansella tamaricis TaxID=2069301 RepID=A0ABS6JKQ1_9BACI|nr:flagellar brake domain-containing protein [Evansella tamaricis]MBU9714257.1 flagellar brake domain-containing protein [Evansella tamaricis]